MVVEQPATQRVEDLKVWSDGAQLRVKVPLQNHGLDAELEVGQVYQVVVELLSFSQFVDTSVVVFDQFYLKKWSKGVINR